MKGFSQITIIGFLIFVYLLKWKVPTIIVHPKLQLYRGTLGVLWYYHEVDLYLNTSSSLYTLILGIGRVHQCYQTPG